MKNRSMGLLGRLFLNVVTLEGRSPGSVVVKKRNTTDAGLKPSSMTLCDERRGGFTLIELLVVVLIIGILSAVALPQYQKAVAKTRFATVKATARALAEAESVYYMANGEFTSDLQSLAIQMPAGGVLGSDRMFYSWGDCYVACQTDSCGGGVGCMRESFIFSLTLKPAARSVSYMIAQRPITKRFV